MNSCHYYYIRLKGEIRSLSTFTQFIHPHVKSRKDHVFENFVVFYFQRMYKKEIKLNFDFFSIQINRFE